MFTGLTKLYFGFRDPATPIMEGIINLHDYIMCYLIFIFIGVSWMLCCIIYSFYFKLNLYTETEGVALIHIFNARNFRHAPTLEVVWTLTPSLILFLIAVPSFALLYSMEEVLEPAITFKAIGHQWFWSYEYSDYISHNFNEVGKVIWHDQHVIFDSNMIYEDELKQGELRLLQVDNSVILPTDMHIRVIITSLDVLHSWGVPSLGIKVDGCPGRLNQAFLFIQRPGTFYGQCSELCGVNHGFMPIVIKATTFSEYITWVKSNLK